MSRLHQHFIALSGAACVAVTSSCLQVGEDPEAVGRVSLASHMTQSDVRIQNYLRSALPTPGEPGRLGHVTDQSRGLFVDQGSLWLQVAGDVFNVQHFGATPDDFAIDTAAIQAAVDAAAASPRGGIVYFPRGEYQVNQSIVLPRNKNKPIVLRGAGTRSTAVHAPGTLLAATTPVITFSFTGAHVEWYHFEDITFSRSNGDYVFLHSQPSDTERLRHCQFRNVDFRAGYDGAPQEVVLISGALETLFTNVAVVGANTGLFLQNSSHVTLINVHTDQDHQLVNGIRISGGGNHTLIGTRVNAVDGGAGVLLQGGASQILFDGIFFEGKSTVTQIDIVDASNVTILNPAIAQPLKDGSTGIRCRAGARNVRVIGGFLADATVDLTRPNSAAIRVDSGARHIVFDDVQIVSKVAQNVVIAPGAIDVRVNLLEGDIDPDTRYTQTAGVMGTIVVSGSSASVREYDFYEAIDAMGTITQLTEGNTGKVVTILFRTAGTSLSVAGNLRLAGGISWSATANDTIRLIYDGTAWYELSRSDN